MRRRSALVALAAIVVHALSPLIAAAAPRMAGETIEVCTAHGIVTVQSDAGGPRSPRAPEVCAACVCHGASTIAFQPSPSATLAPAAPTAADPQDHFPTPPRTASRSRAPPVLA